jgi:hypothetical protein
MRFFRRVASTVELAGLLSLDCNLDLTHAGAVRGGKLIYCLTTNGR